MKEEKRRKLFFDVLVVITFFWYIFVSSICLTLQLLGVI